ncbi:hypothetical protein KC878_03115 [Candidatus Saccharibacteria bacterium]|nr:hypothetical protein [Candidatus Saccharibacteria bacterium]MCB9821714.1 hypothetical protein [Candidatus Nomurabacteria bacterium]
MSTDTEVIGELVRLQIRLDELNAEECEILASEAAMAVTAEIFRLRGEQYRLSADEKLAGMHYAGYTTDQLDVVNTQFEERRRSLKIALVENNERGNQLVASVKAEIEAVNAQIEAKMDELITSGTIRPISPLFVVFAGQGDIDLSDEIADDLFAFSDEEDDDEGDDIEVVWD